VAGGASAGTATILFTDLVGSTELRSRLGDVAADQVRRAHDQILNTAVTDHGGTVVKGLGDGLMASFTAAADAVEAATDIQRGIERANRRADDSRRLAVRIGISAGDVSWEDGDCHGTPVVAAARLCDRAEGGQVLCDDLVRGLARGRTELTFRMVGELELKGLAEPVIAFDVPWEPSVAESAPLPAALLPVASDLPFAGRDRERESLTNLWKSAQTDGHALVLISGEPGVGKTRLTSELSRDAHDDGAWVLCGRCDDSIAAPYAPWIEMLRHAVTHVPDDLLTGHVDRHAGELGRLVSELGRRVPDLPEPRGLDPETERLALFDAVVDLLDAVAATAPVLLVVDDAHWADSASLTLLRHVIRRLPREAPLLVVVTYRDTDVDRSHPLSAMIGDLRREPRVEQLSLRGIDEDGMCALLAAAGGADLNEEGIAFARTLVAETEGNPFFVGEILRHLLETGVLVQEDGQWRAAVPIEEAGIPEGIRDVVGRRLSRLSTEANEVLRVAAVIGREFSVDLLATVAERGDDDVLRDVESAMAASLVNEVPRSPGLMIFSHALVQSTLLDELSTTRRVRLHAAIGEALEARGGATAAELAHHFAEGAATGVADRAVKCALEAADEAQRRVAFDEVVHFYDLALEALDAGQPDERKRAQILIERGYSQHQRGDQEAGRTDAMSAAAIARSIGALDLVGRAGIAHQGLTGHWAEPANPVAVEMMRECLTGLDPDDVATRADVVAALASALILVPGDEALQLAEEAEQLARDVGDDVALLRALNARAWALRSRGRGAELCEVGSGSVRHAQETGLQMLEWSSRYLYGVALVEIGELDRALEQMDLAYAFDVPLKGWGPAVFRASIATSAGRFAEAADLIEVAAACGGDLGDTNEAIRSGQLARLALLEGRVDDALTWCDVLAGTSLGIATDFASVVLAESGDLDAAHARHAAWARDIRPFAPQVVMQWVLSYEATVAFRTNDRELARTVGDELEPFRGHILGGDTSVMGAAEGALGRAVFTQGRFDAAVVLMDEALVVAERLDLHAVAAQQRMDLARALLARGGAGDTDRAHTLLTEAKDAAVAMGMPLAVTEAESLLA
jgi:class 3 adenylate cyclase/tetratricopeptide (TPR) repeat protein